MLTPKWSVQAFNSCHPGVLISLDNLSKIIIVLEFDYQPHPRHNIFKWKVVVLLWGTIILIKKVIQTLVLTEVEPVKTIT